MAPQYMPSSREKASTVGMPKESGMSSATPMAAVRPGNDPKMMPRATPEQLARSAAGVRACCSPAKISIMPVSC